MVQKEGQGERRGNSLLNRMPIDFAEAAKKRFEELTDVQSELFSRFQDTNKQWLDRVQAEAALSSEFVSKLSSARSIPDAVTVCQEWSTRRFEMMAEDAKHVLDDTQKFMQTGAHILASGFASKSAAIST